MKNKTAQKIRSFLKLYAAKNDDMEYTSPDAYQLEAAAELLEAGKKLQNMPWSEWGNGGYKPYTSKKGRLMHEQILKELKIIFYGI